MAAPLHCRLTQARVRRDRAEDLERLIRQMFDRRHHDLVTGPEHSWLTIELVQSLRRQIRVYRALSSKTSGPLPFALGHFRIRDGRLEPVSDELPGNEPPAVLGRLPLCLLLEPVCHVARWHLQHEHFADWFIELSLCYGRARFAHPPLRLGRSGRRPAY